MEHYALGPWAIEYVKSVLKAGNTLSVLQLEVWSTFRNPSVYLPKGLDQERMKCLNVGGIASLRESERCLAETFGEYLGSSPDRCVFLEDWNARPGDPYLTRTGTRYLVYENEVYHVLQGRNPSHEESIRCIRVAHSFRFVCAFSMLSSKLLPENGGAVSLGVLREVARNTQYLAVDAYDGEAFVVVSTCPEDMRGEVVR